MTTVDDSLPHSAELEAFIISCIEEFAPHHPRQIPMESARAFKMTFGCCVQTARYAEAYLMLCKMGLSLEARSLARGALEHAATVEYAYLRRGGLDQLANTSTWANWSINDRMHRWTGIAAYDPGPKPALGAQLPPLSGESGILRILDPGTVLLDPGYAMLSQGVHVTHEAVTAFFRTTPDGAVLEIDHHRSDRLAQYTRFLVAEACMLVSWVYAHICRNQSRLDELGFRSTQLNLPVRLDDDWADEDRPHRDGEDSEPGSIPG